MATVSEATARKPRRKLNPGFDRFSGLYLWALFIIVFGIWVPDQFLTAATLHSVAAQQAVTGIVALAILIPLAAGLYDLSVGATAGLVSVTTVVLMNDHGWGPVPAIAFGMAVAIIIGCTNAFIVVRLGVNSFIATLGMSSILAATQVIVSHNAQPLPPTSTGWNNFTQTTVGGLPDRRALPAHHRVRVVVADGAHADRPLPVRHRRQPRGRPSVGRSDPAATRRSRSCSRPPSPAARGSCSPR